MNSFISMYGKMVIFITVILGLIIFTFSRGSDGFIGLVSKAEPVATVKSEDASFKLESVSKRANPTLEITPKKLSLSEIPYNLEDPSVIGIKAVNADGVVLPVKVTKVRYTDGPLLVDFTGIILGSNFKPIAPGSWLLTYETMETYLGVVKKTSKAYCFVVDS